ncbi:DUF5719 family protein [Agromyces aerolatus]|uniref:DUF5719 family protein n=1 Tax=Agromyces sp. LY-1074 TaxID=3074080 RepID=UPI0028579EF0|nr:MULTISPECIES: DUF5719 family protein [unclassified Agromyces]MDR5700397.1 DUF5719 family protein [Agromyces sp. LY-1074]MDR5706625.1 DUF5719 family protein [Agromyces sp. LY-1358]
MPARRSYVIAGVRGLAAAAALAVGAGAVAAAALVPWPSYQAEPASVVVEPSESPQVRVCPGPLLALADDASSATTASSFGDVSLVTQVEPAQADVEEVEVNAPGNPDADADGTPIALTTAPGDVAAGLLAGAQSQSAGTETIAGLAVAACREAVAESWLVGGSTALGRVTLVLLANPTDVAATVELRVFGEAGPVEAPSAVGLQVPAHGQRVVSLAGLAPNVASPVVQVTSTGGRIAASLQQTAIDGLVPAGVELVGASARPAQSQQIPGVLVTGDHGVAVDEDHAEGDAFPALRLFAPGEEPVVATIGVISESGGGGTSAEVNLQPGQVTDVPLGELAAGPYSVEIEADAPVVAAARSTIPSEAGTPDAPDGATGDVAWFSATAPLIGDTAVAVADGPGPQLHLRNPGDEVADVTIVAGGGERSVEVEAGSAVEVGLTSGQGLVLRGAEGLHASVSYRSARQLASMPVEPPGPLDAPIRIYPR